MKSLSKNTINIIKLGQGPNTYTHEYIHRSYVNIHLGNYDLFFFSFYAKYLFKQIVQEFFKTINFYGFIFILIDAGFFLYVILGSMDLFSPLVIYPFKEIVQDFYFFSFTLLIYLYTVPKFLMASAFLCI